MKGKTKKYLIFAFSIVLALGVYGLLMYGLLDFNSTTNDSGLLVDDPTTLEREGYDWFNLDDTDADAKGIGRAVGEFLWETRAIDVILVGIMLMVASESAATMVRGIEDQCSEFRKSMCDTDKFIILEEAEQKEAEA